MSEVSAVTIAGAGALGRALAERLPLARLVGPSALPEGRLWRADLTSIPEAEVALAGTRTLVVLAQARRAPARLTRADLLDVDRLIADSLARAAQRSGVEHLVLFACGPDDPREGLLRASGIPLSVLRGGGPDPLAQLEALVRRGHGPDVEAEPWQGAPPQAGPRDGLLVCSVQRYAVGGAWTAQKLARAYLDWLPGQVATVRVTSSHGASTIHAFGSRALMLRLDEGRSEAQSVVYDVADGALVSRGLSGARFEFRVLLDGSSALSALIGFEPSLPWPVYHVTQALMHERVMKRFGAWLSKAEVS